MDKKKYQKPQIVDETIDMDDIIMVSTDTDNSKKSAFKSDAGIWDLFKW